MRRENASCIKKDLGKNLKIIVERHNYARGGND
jgi:hypothetical protein